MDPNRKADINDPGKPGTMQRLIYSSARVGHGFTWKQINALAQSLLSMPRDNQDTEYSLLLNALCCATEKSVKVDLSIIPIVSENFTQNIQRS